MGKKKKHATKNGNSAPKITPQASAADPVLAVEKTAHPQTSCQFRMKRFVVEFPQKITDQADPGLIDLVVNYLQPAAPLEDLTEKDMSQLLCDACCNLAHPFILEGLVKAGADYKNIKLESCFILLSFLPEINLDLKDFAAKNFLL